MQKHYREYTVGELLDMGAKVTVNHYDAKTEEEAKRFTSQFENTKQSTKHIKSEHREFDVVKAWKEKFEVNVFLTGR